MTTPQDPSDSPAPGWQPPDAAPPQEPERPGPYEGTYGSSQPPPGTAPYGGAPPHPGQAHPGGAHPAPYAEGPPPGGPQLAGRWARLGGAILDSLIVGAASVPFIVQAIKWDELNKAAESGDTMVAPGDVYDIPRLLIGYAFALVIGFAYYVVQHVKWGQTIGKRAAGTRVVRASDNGAIGWGEAITRQVVTYIFSVGSAALNFVVPIFGVLGILDPAWILWDQRRQALHDKAAGTVVLKVDHRAPNPYHRG
ncbi:RDD family protein [Spirillospora sp. NPDC047279]|uniref:RDD family protein n=1 Tax=Spirillospora sp. NPDC047279 TaxID=3155478 RepID=UPI0033E496E6